MNRNYIRSTLAVGLSLLLTAGYTESTAHAAMLSDQREKPSEVKKEERKNFLILSERLLSNKQQQDHIAKRIKDTEKQIETIKEQMNEKQADIDQREARTADLKNQIDKLSKRIKERNGLFKKRIRSMYINNGAISYLNVLFGAESFGNFIDRLLSLKVIAEKDREILAVQKQDREKKGRKQAILQNELRNLGHDFSALKTLHTRHLKQEEKRKNELSQLKERTAKIKEETMDEREETDVERDQTRMHGSHAFGKVEDAHLIRPAEGYLSSGFGPRSFDGDFHPGIDIANSTGTPVKAAAEGVIFRAYPSSSYGKTVMISHRFQGKLYTTVYAHLSSYQVSEGQNVFQGQVIGKMGSTGESYGSHLHFELYQGTWTPAPHKGAVNPVRYFQ
ncbi:hypothetical protein EWH99_03115 [Sporolactobacillus sp. THM7-7]|nr:hypothetical protein EWH99_03115 [Sporolactobacillus sp. THM7-7]